MNIDISRLDRAFNPQCVAVVGDSGENNIRWLHAQRDFKGKLYSVQVNPKSITESPRFINYTVFNRFSFITGGGISP